MKRIIGMRTVGALLALAVAAAALPPLLPPARAAEANVVYTKTGSNREGTGTQGNPYTYFEDALTNVADGGTIIVMGSALINEVTPNNTPFVFDKNVTVKGQDGISSSLNIRAAGLVLGADVTMENLELSLTQKLNSAIFVNGHTFTATNVTYYSGSNPAHLFAGGLTSTDGTKVSPTAGKASMLNLTGSKFANIYAGGVKEGFDGDVTITAKGCTLGPVYGSGARGHIDGSGTQGTVFPGEADTQFDVTGLVTITTDYRSATHVDAMDCLSLAVTVTDPVDKRPLKFPGVRNLQIAKKTDSDPMAYVTELSSEARVVLSGGGLNLAALASAASGTATIGTLSGSGKLALDKDQRLDILGDFTGTYDLWINNPVSSSVSIGEALEGHTYITAGGNNVSAAVSFKPHSSQPNMRLVKTGKQWTASSQAAAPATVEHFAFTAPSGTVTQSALQNGGYEAPVTWAPSDASDLLDYIPFQYTVGFDGVTYTAADPNEPGLIVVGSASNFVELAAVAADPDNGPVHDAVVISGVLSPGVYTVTATAPKADGSTVSSIFILTVSSDSQGGQTPTPTQTILTAADTEFGESIALSALVTSGSVPVDGGSVTFYVNGKQVAAVNGLSAGQARAENVEVSLRQHFKAGSNAVQAVFTPADSTQYAPSQARTDITVSKAAGAAIQSITLPGSGVFTGEPYAASAQGAEILSRSGAVLDTAPQVSFTYQAQDGQGGRSTEAPRSPGTYTVFCSAPEGETYAAISDQAVSGVITIGKAKPKLTVTAAQATPQKGQVTLLAKLAGYAPSYPPAGTVTFTWDTETKKVSVDAQGTAALVIPDVPAGSTHTYSAVYISESPLYLDSAPTDPQSVTTDPDGDAQTGHTVTFDPAGGTVSVTSARTDAAGRLTVPLPEAVRQGHTFKGWFLASSGGEAVKQDHVYTADTTLYAQWSANGGGSGGGGGGGSSGGGGGGSSGGGSSSGGGQSPTVPVQPEEPRDPPLPFTDVKETDYFYDAVQWAVKNGVTSGVTADTFGPHIPCIRVQTVTFLWRSAGSPEPKTLSDPFTDVPSDAYYHKAILWAVEQGIAQGIGGGLFGSGRSVTRAQLVTFLWRSAGSPEPKTLSGPFTDVSPDAYYHKAILWAAEQGITQGLTATAFAPDRAVTRAQSVTFLYRAAAGIKT